MLFANLDQICNRTLLERGLPKHWYLEELMHSSACVRELSFDTLQIINTLQLPVNEYNSIDLPGDFVDDLGLSIAWGGRLVAVPKDDSLTPLRYHDDTGTYVPPVTDATNLSPQTTFGFGVGILWYWNINDYGEPTGRFFGAKGASNINGYKVVTERRQIQLSQTFTAETAVLSYISDGQRADNATQVDVQATACIQAYSNWKKSPNRDNENSPEGRAYYNQKRLLRARKDDLTKTDIIQIVRRSYTASMKN
jgi:hypothetical protein